MAAHAGRQTRRTQHGLRWLGLAAWVVWLALGAAAQPAARTGPAQLLPPPASVPLAGPLVLAVRLPTPAPAPAQRPEFPAIEGFRKEKLVASMTTRLLPGGQRRTELTYSQRYYPYTEGSYVIPAFDLLLNGQVLHSPAASVQVGAGPAGSPPAGSGSSVPGTSSVAIGSLDKLLGKPRPQNFYEPADHAYLTLEADRERVYVGQGVRVQLALYLEPADQAVLNFYDFNNQLAALRQQLRQPSAWQAPAPDPAALPDTLRRPGRPLLLRFGLLDYTYYPLAAQPLRFPALTLTLTKFRLLKNPQPGDDARLASYKIYRSSPLRVAVRPLPGAAADSSAVAVGAYTLRESLSETRPHTGQAFTYTFGVEGRGNPAAVVPRPGARPPGLAVYGPDISQTTLEDGRWRKTFRYRLVAGQPGPLALAGLVRLPFFDPATGRYDTLRPGLQAQVQGPALPATARPADDPFYGPALARADRRLQPLDVYRQVGRYAGWLLASLLGLAAVGWWRAGRLPH